MPPTLVAAPSRDPTLSTGPSPGTPRRTVHLLGAGKVGRAFLRQLATCELPVRLVAVSDRSATVFAPAGLDGSALAGWKESGRRFAAHPRAAGIALDVALAVANAEIVVDCTSSDLAKPARVAARRRTRTLLDEGRQVVLANKTALLGESDGPRADPQCSPDDERDGDLLAASRRERLHVNAVFGGTGAALFAELDELRARCRAIACVPNATTSAVLDARAKGASLREAIDSARALGLTEHEPLQDLDGRDAALKLALLARVVFGTNFAPEAIARPGARALLQARGPRRLVGRISTHPETLEPRLAFEEVAPASRLATSSGHVVYCYELADGRTRVHVGAGVGPDGTARALLEDVRRAIGVANASSGVAAVRAQSELEAA